MGHSRPSGGIQNAAENSDGVGSEAVVLAWAPSGYPMICVDLCRSVSNFPTSQMFEEEICIKLSQIDGEKAKLDR